MLPRAREYPKFGMSTRHFDISIFRLETCRDEICAVGANRRIRIPVHVAMATAYGWHMETAGAPTAVVMYTLKWYSLVYYVYTGIRQVHREVSVFR
jgi:hypothetical protein